MTKVERSGRRGTEDRLRERILVGAAEAFGRLGYADTRVEDILHASSISRPTFYRVFKSKEEVFDALSSLHHEEIRRRIVDAAASTDDLILRLERALLAFARWRADLGPIGRVLDAEARGPGSRQRAQREAILGTAVGLVHDIVHAAGHPTPDPALLRGLIAANEAIADELLTGEGVGEAEIQRAKELMTRIFLGTLMSRGSEPSKS